MSIQAVVVVVAVVHPLGKHLTGECIPIPVKQRVPLLLRHGSEARNVVGVVFQQLLVVEHGRRDEDARLPADLFAAVGESYLDRLPNGLHRFRCRDKALFHPAMSDAAGVRLRAHVAACVRPVRAVAGKHVAVFFPKKLCQLVEVDIVVSLALVVVLVLGVLHRAEIDLRAAWERPDVLLIVVARRRERGLVDFMRAVDQLGKLRVGLAEDKPAVVRDTDLTQRFRERTVRLAAAGSAAI